MLRKYYTILWQSFSNDHVANIKLLNRHLTVTEGFYADVVSTTDPDAANKMILNALIHWLKQDDKIMEFCKVMRILATNRKYAKEVLQFEIGRLPVKCHYCRLRLLNACAYNFQRNYLRNTLCLLSACA